MSQQNDVEFEETQIPNPDAAGVIPYFDPPIGEEHPDQKESDL